MSEHEASAASAARRAGPRLLADALRDARTHTLATFAAYERALGDRAFAVPYSTQLNPPLWELGHVGWFQEWWLRRFSERGRGPLADPNAPRLPPRRSGADALYDSSRVAHPTRWHLPLPDTAAVRDDLAQTLHDSLALLRDARDDSDELYFFRLCLFHEDMHHEAAVYMAQHLGIALDGWKVQPHSDAADLVFARTTWQLGHDGSGFTFDNELNAHDVVLRDYCIDSAPVTWANYVHFVEAGGYATRSCWSDAGWQWLQSERLRAPRYLLQTDGTWRRRTFGSTIDLDPRAPAMNLSCFEAEA